MNITFGILTKDNQRNVNTIIESIVSQNIPLFEIFIIGEIEDTWNVENIHIIQDDIDNNKNHITKKKNDIIRNAKYETIVIMKVSSNLS